MNSTESIKTKHGRKRHFWLLLAVPVALGAGFCALHAQASDDGFSPSAFGGGTPEQHKAFMEHRLDKMLDMLKATDSQRTAIKAIAKRLFTEMQPIHQSHDRLHEDALKAFTADTVEGATVDNLRGQVTSLVDQSSKVFSKALLDAAQVLTPEQRQTLAKFIQEHHGKRHHF